MAAAAISIFGAATAESFAAPANLEPVASSGSGGSSKSSGSSDITQLPSTLSADAKTAFCVFENGSSLWKLFWKCVL
ncbi:hypothetical protein ACFVUS_29880 [Nocardia sp. NPDC058058]|uniref:hypothetical protein n=1 Tax=Nocardia sp. NPDC058058 TaxID=3346317 RepID=UPI0036DAED57